MKKIIFAISTLFCVAGLSFAQSKSLAEPNPEDVGSGSAASALREVSIEKFERDGAWNVHISPDAGVISARLFEGSPAAKEVLEEDKGRDVPYAVIHGYVLALVDIAFHHCDSPVIFGSHSFHSRSKGTARAAPGCPEIHHYYAIAGNDLGEILICCC